MKVLHGPLCEGNFASSDDETPSISSAPPNHPPPQLGPLPPQTPPLRKALLKPTIRAPPPKAQKLLDELPLADEPMIGDNSSGSTAPLDFDYETPRAKHPPKMAPPSCRPTFDQRDAQVAWRLADAAVAEQRGHTADAERLRFAALVRPTRTVRGDETLPAEDVD